MDSLLVVEAEGYSYRLEDWSGDAPDMPLFVGDQYRPMSPKRVERVDDGLLLVLDSEVAPDDQIFWAGRACTLTPAEPIWPTKLVARRDDGTVASLFRRREEAKRVVLVVEGCSPVVLEDERGIELPHRVAEPHEGATRLRVGREEIPWTGQRTLTLEEPPPAQDALLADNGVRWAWSDNEERGRRQRRVWIQLLPSDEVDSEAVLDIRTAYMEEGVREVRTKKGNNPQHAFKVWGFQRDNYRLELDRLPPKGTTLFVPSSTSGLQRQRQAVFRFKDNPLPHHGALLRLCEAPDKVRWPRCRPKAVSRWYLLGDECWSGTIQQREFVEKALGTPDFAFLEGPPGSGKTHAICELVLQFIDQGLNVLLCSTTHVAVDNVLERLVGEFEQVEAVRIGLADRVDQAIRPVQIDERISALVETWRDVGTFADLDTAALERVAEATILSSVNLTCGTSTGILAHPYIRRSDARRDNDTGPSWPHFDVLIIDEASKTTFQEFLVPAQLARKWIVVGDVRQLPPFSEPKDLEASIAEVGDENDAMLSDAHQAALLISFRLQRPEAGVRRVRWLIEESNDVLDALSAEIEARVTRGDRTPEIVRVVQGRSAGDEVSIADIEAGQPVALYLFAADWILFPPELRNRLAPYLPPDGLALRDWDSDSAHAYRFARWLAQRGHFFKPVREQRRRFQTADELATRQRDFLREESWAKQVSWRLGRVHQLATARDDGQRERRQGEVDSLMPAVEPYSKWVPPAIDAIRDVGVRSVIESFRVRRSNHRVRRLSALTEALPQDVWNERAVLIEYQHRMHPDISQVPREQFYEGIALKDANTLDGRDKRDGWYFMPKVPARRVWVDVRGHEERGVNQAEIKAMQSWLEAWRDYAKNHPRTDGKDWTVACLSFYHRQELGTRDMLRRLTGTRRAETRFALPNTTLSCATVDRFQGREADLVLLSLRNTSRPGHMDSPNRLNVGITRARFLLVVFGHRKYFAEDCPSDELNALADATPLFDLGSKR